MVRAVPSARIHSIPDWLNGIFFGIAAIVAMLVSQTLDSGLIFDCRSGIMGTAALIGGPVCALASIPLPFLWRFHLGGSGVFPGLLEIVLPAILGSICYRSAELELKASACDLRLCTAFLWVSAQTGWS